MEALCGTHPCHLGFLMILWLTILPNRSAACPKSCACYVPTEVHCTFRYLTLIPRHIQANVERINLGYNSLSRLMEHDFSGLQKLELLMLHSNEIQTIHESTFNDLSSLQVLKMSYNKIKSLHKNTFLGLKSMVRLHMDHNKLEFLHPESFYGLTSLKLVHLEGNSLRQLHTDTFVTLRYIQIFKTSSIKHVYLSGNQLSSLPKDMLLYMTELEGLYLHDNPWSCDCNLLWLIEGSQQFRELIKCKRDRGGQQCPICASPRKNKGKSLSDISPQDLVCAKPTIDNIFKTKNATITEEGEGFTVISPKDFVVPMGTLILNMTDNSGNEANLACSVQRPTKMSQITLDIKPDHTTLRTAFSSFLVCNIDYDNIQKLWGILAMYSDSPMKLKRELLLTKTPFISYKYRQSASDDDVFTDIEAELRAEPNWLMQDTVTLQLDRSATSLSMLHIRYFADILLTIPNSTEKPLKANWAMILKSNQTKTEFSALIGGTVEMDCQVLGEPTPSIDWVLPDGTKIRAPYVSEEGRITLTKDGKFILKAADSFDTGIYHCMATNYIDADILSFRITVLSADVEEDNVNGAELTVSNGDALYLPCGSHGIPDASISWILPDRSILHESSRNKIIYSNGTLKIQDITQRDRGNFRCLAANQYGLDILTHKVLVKEKKVSILHKTQKLHPNDDGNEEASGNEDFEENSNSAKAIERKTILAPNRFGNLAKEFDRTRNRNIGVEKRTKINKRIRGHRRQFTHTTRKIDPQRWSEIFEKTKQNAMNSKKEKEGVEGPVKEKQELERSSGEVAESSGEELLPVEEHFLILTTKPSAVLISNATVTAKAVTDVNTTPVWTAKEEEQTFDLPLGTSDPKSHHYLDTLTHTTNENYNEEPTTHSFLNSTSIDVIAQPTTTSRTLYTTTNSQLPSTLSSLNVKSDLTTPFNSLTGTPQIVITSPLTTIGYTDTASQNTVTIPPTTAGYVHTTPQAFISDSTTSVNKLHEPPKNILNTPVTTSNYLNISSENVVTYPFSDMTHSTSSPQKTNINPTPVPTDLFISPPNDFTSQPASSRNLVVTQIIPDKLHDNSISQFRTTIIPSETPTSYKPLISKETVTKSAVIQEDRMSNTPAARKELVKMDISKSEISVITPSLTTQFVHVSPKTSPSLSNSIETNSLNTVQSEADIMSATTSNPPWTNELFSQYNPPQQTQNQIAKVQEVSVSKDKPEEAKVVSIDSSTKSMFLSQTDTSPIYIHSTQKIISSGLPEGSTIITQQQIQIVKNVTPFVPTMRRYGRRRISGKRRIIRPDRITNMHKLKFGKFKEYAESTTAQKNIPAFTTQGLFSKNSSPTAIAVLPTTHHVSPTITFNTMYGKGTPLSIGLTLENTNPPSSNNYISYSLSATTPTVNTEYASTSNYTISSQSVSTSQENVGISTNSNSFTPYQPATLGIHDKKMEVLDTPQNKIIDEQNREYISTPSPKTTVKSRTASRMLRRKIPWHRLFGNNKIRQSEIFRKLRKNSQHTSTVAMPTISLLSSPKMIGNALFPTKASNQIDPIHTSVAKEPIVTESTIRQTATDVIHPTLSSPMATSEATTIVPTKIVSTSEAPTSFITSGITAKHRFLKRKQPRKKTLVSLNTSKSLLKTNMSTLTPSIFQTTVLKSSTVNTLERNTKMYAITQHPQLFVGTVADKKTAPLSNIVNNILVSSEKTPDAKTSSLPPNKTVMLTKPLPTPYLVPPQNNYITTPHHLPSEGTYLRRTVTATRFKTTTLKPGPFIESTTSNPETFLKSTTLNPGTSASPTLSPYKATRKSNSFTMVTAVTVKPQTTSIKKATINTLQSRPHAKTSDFTQKNLRMTTKPPHIVRPYKNNLLHLPTHYGKNIDKTEKSIQETTTMNVQNVEQTSHNIQSKPKIIGGKAASFTVLANSDAFIPCEATGNPTPTVLWTKVSSGTFASKTRRGNKMEVFTNGTLSISSVGIEDRGQYLCVATNQYGSDRLLVTLSVITYPPKILQAKSREITVHSGSSVDVKCEAEGRPFPTITWILANETIASESHTSNHKVLVQPDGTLTMKDVTIYDRGIYKCLATNIAGTDTSIVRIQVIAAPPVILEDKRQMVVAASGETIKLHCTAKGNPHPTVYWVASDGTKVKPLQYVNPKLFLFSNGTLYIRNIALTDSGNYECIATSSTGSERRVISLTVRQSETVPKIVYASPQTTEMSYGDKLMLNCTATGQPKPRIIWRLPSKAVVDQWHRMGSRIHVFPNGSLLVESVTDKDAGDYLCVARNKMGDDLILMKVSVSMKPAKIIHKQHLTKQVPYGKDFKVDCKASGSPLPEISWSLPDGTVINNVFQADYSGKRKRRYILFDNGTLYLNKVGMAEEGDYTCYAENTLGKDEMKVHITVVAAAPRIQVNHKTYIVAGAGESAVLHCEAIGEPKPKIFWLLPSSDMIATSHERYVLHDNGSLTINQIKLLDAGEYMCVARNPAGDDTKLLKLDVQPKPPIINGLYTNKTIIKDTALKHSRKLINCRAEGTAPLQIMWIMPDNIYLTAPYHGSRIIVHQNGTLEIRNIRPSDTAEFTCVARNDGGESMLVVQLEVVDVLRRPMFKNPFNEKIIAKPGKMVILNCFADGNPTPEIMWLLPNGTRFFNGQKFSKYYAGNNGTLIIYSPSKDDAGKYRCAARNKIGYIEKLIILEVGQSPTIFTHPRGPIKSIIGETLSLHCLSDGIPRPSVTWTLPSGYIVDKPYVNGKYMLLDNGTLVIQETTIHDRGNYLCKAKNNAGEASISVPVMVVAYPPRITNKAPQHIHIRAGSPVHLNCMAIGIPKPEITWELPDLSLLSTASKGRPTGTELLHPQGTLVIQNPRYSDTGMYKCIAKNPLGTDTSSTYLKVI
ncbi:immunoglobulin superfamily member 10 [Spea bombifrons]|uniref:immunoglobulin superfamily member 10 n=1 Tax=Spea bombifrons TaxID=233779 RepID=UPI00234B94F9|nr:immunoglobulin superfamily member 10 [Spea bombifrons]